MTVDPDKVQKEFRHCRRQATVAFVILTVGIIAAFAIRVDESKQRDAAIVKSGTAIIVEGCNRDYTTIQAARAAVARARANTRRLEKSGAITPAEADAGQDQYDFALTKLVLPDCVAASKILSSDPGKAPAAQPTPLVP